MNLQLQRSSIVWMLLLCFGMSTSLWSQASGYSFSQSSQTYVPLGGSATTVPDLISSFGEDDVEIGFNFEFEGVTYDSVAVSSDGVMSFVLGATSYSLNNLDNGSSSRRPLLAPLWDDLAGEANASVARYETSGSAPNRVFTFEWSNWEWTSASNDSVVSFQVKLYETSNEIEFHYKWECSSCIDPGADASIGLSGANTFLSLTNIGPNVTASNVSEDSDIDTVVTNAVYKFVPPACPAPMIGDILAFGKDTVQLNWDATGGTTFEVNWDEAGFTAGDANSNFATVSNDTFYTATGLNSGTEYDFYVRKDCGGGQQSVWVGPISATTIYGLPYTQDFTGGFTSTDYTEGQGLISDSTTFIYTTSGWTNDDFGNTGSNDAARENIYGTTNDDWMFSPAIDLGTTAAQIEFDAALTQYNSSAAATLAADDTVKLVISTDNGTTWSDSNTVLTLHSGSIISATGTHYIVDISKYSGVIKFAFYTESTVSNADLDFFVDNIEVKAIPACPEPTMLMSSNITASSIDLSWDSQGSGPWYLSWAPCGFDQATATIGRDTLTSKSAVINNLDANTGYDFYLVEDCGVDGLSDTTIASCVRTECGVYNVPFTENFNSGSQTEFCWTVLNQNADNDTWDLNSTAQPKEGDEAAEMYTDFNSGSNDDWLISPAIELSGNDRLKYSYSVRSSSEPNDFMVLISTSGMQPSDFTDTLLPLTAYSNESYMEEIINLSAYNDTVHIAWHVPSGGLDGWELYIDDVIVEQLPNCPASTKLTAQVVYSDSVSFSWTPGGSAVNYGIEYGPAGFSQGAGMLVSTTDTFTTVKNLTPGTAYDFYVVDSCQGSNSIYSNVLKVRTLCNPAVAPFTENFDGSAWVASTSNDSIDPCWTRSASAGAYAWIVGTGSTGSGSTGPDQDVDGNGNYLYTESSDGSAGDPAWITTPLVDVTSLTTPYLTYNYHRYGATVEDLHVLITEDGMSWDTVDVISGQTQSSSADTFLLRQVDISTYGPVVRVRFSTERGTSYTGDQAIDEVSIEEAPACPNALNLAAIVESDSSASMIWDGVSQANSYHVWIGSQGFFQGTGTTAGVKTVVSGDSLYLDTLADDECYEFLVRSLCGNGDSSAWVGPVSFCTPPSCPAPTDLGVDPSTVTINSGDIFWTTGGASDFNVEYGMSGFTPGTGTMVSATNDTLSLSGLSSGTTYEFYVRDSCGQGDVSTWTGPFAFTTAYTPNFLETFNGSFDNEGWMEADGQLTANTIFTSSSSTWTFDDFGNNTSNTDAQKVNIYTDDQYEWVISPSIYLDPNTPNLQIEFDAAITEWISQTQGYLGSDDSLAIVISTDNGASWSDSDILWLATDADTIDAAGEHHIVSLSGYSGYVRFGFYAGSTVDDTEDNDLYIENFEVRVPAACAEPSALMASDITTDSALVSWTAGDAAAAIDWTVILTSGGQTPANGTAYTSTNDSLWLTGLNASSNYCLYLVEQCANGYSDTLGPVCFTTSCSPFTAPYSQNFDGAPAVDPFDGIACWSVVGPGANDIELNDSPDPGVNMPPSLPNAVELNDGDFDGGDTAILVSPEFSDLTSGAVEMQFEAAFENTSEELFIGVMSDGGDASTLVILDTITTSTEDVYNTYTYSFNDPSKLGNAKHIAFVHGTDIYEVYIDNFVYRSINCPAPTALAVDTVNCDSITVSWTSNSGSSLIQYGPAGFTPGNGTFANNVTSPYTISGLAQNTDYDIWVADTCGGDTSDFIGPITVSSDSLAPLMASFTASQFDTSMTDAMVAVDASASTGEGLSYSWDFGGADMMDTTSYTSNGSYDITLTVTDRCGNTDDTTVTVVIGGISVIENAFNAELSVFPNPSQGEFKVKLSQGDGTYEMIMTDLRGRQIMQRSGLTPGTEYRLDAGNVAEGVYLLHFSGEGLSISKRLVIE